MQAESTASTVEKLKGAADWEAAQAATEVSTAWSSVVPEHTSEKEDGTREDVPAMRELPALTVLDERTLIVSGLLGAGGETLDVQHWLTDSLVEKCGTIADVHIDSIGSSALVTFISAAAAEACVGDEVVLGSVNVTFSPSYVLGNSSFDGLAPVPQPLEVCLGYASFPNRPNNNEQAGHLNSIA